MITPEERVQTMLDAFYAPKRERERMANLLCRVSDMVIADLGDPSPLDLQRLHWSEQQNIARLIRQYAKELLTVD